MKARIVYHLKMVGKMVIIFVTTVITIILVLKVSDLIEEHELKKLPGVQDVQGYFETYKQINPVPKNCSVEGPIDTNDRKQKAKVYTYIYQCEKGKSPDGQITEIDLKYLFVICAATSTGNKLQYIPEFENMPFNDPTKKSRQTSTSIWCGSKGPI